MEPESQRTRNLVTIKLLHTFVWAFIAGCILAIPITGAEGRFHSATILSGIVLAECLLLALNHGRCPLTDVAGRYTADRAENFDIYLPPWLARYNKIIFGVVFVAAELFLLWRWMTSVK
jgi:hypothetical protein